MDGLARVAAGGIPIKFGGEDLILDAPTLRDFATMENHLLTKRPNVIVQATLANRELMKMAKEEARAVPDSDPDCVSKRQAILSEAQSQADAVMNKAVDRAAKVNKISPQELADFSDSPAGAAFLLWLKLHHRYPNRNFTLSHVTEVCEKMADDDFAELLARRDQAAGTDILGNSTGQLKTETETTKESETEKVDLFVAGSTGGTSSGT